MIFYAAPLFFLFVKRRNETCTSTPFTARRLHARAFLARRPVHDVDIDVFSSSTIGAPRARDDASDARGRLSRTDGARRARRAARRRAVPEDSV